MQKRQNLEFGRENYLHRTLRQTDRTKNLLQNWFWSRFCTKDKLFGEESLSKPALVDISGETLQTQSDQKVNKIHAQGQKCDGTRSSTFGRTDSLCNAHASVRKPGSVVVNSCDAPLSSRCVAVLCVVPLALLPLRVAPRALLLWPMLFKEASCRLR